MKPLLRAAALRVLRAESIRRVALAAAAMRHRALILVYHRIVPETSSALPRAGSIVPVVSTSLLRRQLEALSTIGDVVPLRELIGSLGARSSPKPGRVRFCLTFDDDEPSHAHQALPVLKALGVPATFFLCGRALMGLGAPWWVLLEAQIAGVGLATTAASLGVSARSAAELASVCEGTSLVAVIERTFSKLPMTSILSRTEIGMLGAASGVTIGFHTVEHPVLTLLDDAGVARALQVGREALAELAGAPVDLFAYPHGRSDSRTARLAEASGFRGACRSGNRPVGAGTCPFLLARWEPGPLEVPELVAQAALRVNLRSRA